MTGIGLIAVFGIAGIAIVMALTMSIVTMKLSQRQDV